MQEKGKSSSSSVESEGGKTYAFHRITGMVCFRYFMTMLLHGIAASYGLSLQQASA
jgi:hypothetical protein